MIAEVAKRLYKNKKKLDFGLYIVNSVQGVKEYNVNMAATLLTGLVPLTIYFISGKLFVRGIAAGAVKG